ncbi:putative tetratricopeptide repeat-containing domain protein [Bifidobacterium cuniculi]|uniref:Putative tetratricopeptide repeat-containing domain protein n=2 Tax=Bifidobacterium cuniculi TaxID=1688 RepID=A0A087AJL6_9BIFI|nr:tetratricopeptide repeat protein [Bifidobacterium cuniculi]KFI58966.1 putative tetratricopeptide repeat-containing domain protein [Bifidobacterium cuniculi]
MADNAIIKLPLIHHLRELKDLPGQRASETFGICTDIVEPKGQGLGYLVEVVGKRKVRILAWLAASGAVYSTDAPLEGVPSGQADLHLDPWDDQPDTGAIRVASPTDATRAITVGEYRQAGPEDLEALSCSADLGIYGEHGWPKAQFLAALWYANVFKPVERGEQPGAGSGRIGEMLRVFLEHPLPDAVDMVIYRGTTNAATATPFERYAARQLVEAGAGELRQIAAENSMDVIRLSTGMFWIRFDADEVQGLQRDVVLAVEAALNRMADCERSAGRQDNGMALLTTLNEQQCFFAGLHGLHDFDEHVRFVESCADMTNRLQELRGTTAARGGVWDTMTRFTTICERLILPYRLEYRCEVDPASGKMAVLFTVPTALMCPSSQLWDKGWEDVRASRPAHAAAYALRLAGLVADAAFISGVSVTGVDVTGCLGSLEGARVLSLGFDRIPFQLGTLPAYLNDQVNELEQDDDPAALLALLKPARQSIAFGPDRGLTAIEPLPVPAALHDKHVPLWRDTRELPDDLKALLRADRACELDVMHDDGAISLADVFAITEQNEDSPATAVLETENALMQLQASLPEPAGRVPLNCEHPYMRLMVDRLPGNADTRYQKMPDGLFMAHLSLSRLYRDQTGDMARAEAQGHALAAIGPTTAKGYMELALTAAETEDYAKAADALIKGLDIAMMPFDVTFMYYRLAYALWQMKDLEAALACYAMVLALPECHLTEMARQEAHELIDEMAPGRQLPEVDEAQHILRAHGIPFAPSKANQDLLAKAAIGLVDAGFPLAADEAVWLLGTLQDGDVLPSLRRSLRYGVEDAEAFRKGEHEA